MKILVVGGSYFLGRVFVMLAQEGHEVTVVNRGSQPLTGLKVREIHGDRHDESLWRQCAGAFDVLVDFCAYQQGDIRTALDNLAGSVKQYIFISTVDVYRHGEPGVRTEGSPFEVRQYPGEAGAYIAGKVALEQELRELCGEKGIAFTVLRPAFLYGPLNYAPRETVFIQAMARDHVLPVITGADGRFQFLYVKDGAEAILKCLLNEKAYGQAYNLCGEEIVDYGMLADALRKAAGQKAPRAVELSVEQAESQGFPLPFPVSEAESLICANAKSKEELGMAYTTLEAGMAKTCRAFWDILANAAGKGLDG